MANQLGKGGNFVRGLLNFLTFGLIDDLHYKGGDRWWDPLKGAVDNASATYLGTGLSDADKQANEFSHNEAELAYQRQREFYQDFQSPESMVRQYEEAGLNPALMYNSGGVSSGVISSSAPSSVTPRSGDLGQLLSLLSGIAFRAKEVRAETQLKSAQSRLIRSQAIGQDNENSVFAERFDFFRKVQNATLENIGADTFLKNAQGALAEQGISESEARTTLLHYQGITEKSNSEYADRLNKSLLDIRESAIELNKAQAEFASSQSAESKQRLTEAQQSWGSRWRAIQEYLKSLENENSAFWTDKRVNELIALSEIFSNYKKQFKIGPFGGEEIDWQRFIDKNRPSMYSPLVE